MIASSSPHRVRVPAGSRDWLLPLADPRAQILRSADIGIVGISEVRAGFDWSGPGTTHLMLGTLEGAGFLEANGQRFPLPEGHLVLAPAGVPRYFACRASDWRFVSIRLRDGRHWSHLADEGVRPLAGHWLRRLVAPVEGMLAEHPLGSPIPAHTDISQPGGESPAEYLFSRYSDRLGEAGAASEARTPRADAFELHATILRHQIESVLREPASSEHDDEAVALASLWSRVVDRPRGPWNAENLASALGVSRTSLYRMVRRQHATSPARVVERLRADEARRLLTQSQYSIEVIADQVGYASAFSFSAAFKRWVGHSPSRFRRNADANAVANAVGD